MWYRLGCSLVSRQRLFWRPQNNFTQIRYRTWVMPDAFTQTAGWHFTRALRASPARQSDFSHGSSVYQETQVEAARLLMTQPQNYRLASLSIGQASHWDQLRFKGWRIEPQLSMGEAAKNFQPSLIYHIPPLFGHKHSHGHYSLPNPEAS